jgi:uncharacterized protein (TIGR02145 family)
MMRKIIYLILFMFLIWACAEKEGEELFDLEETPETFIDSRDNQEYKWVKIGNQIWMAENLAYLSAVSSGESENEDLPQYYVYGYYGTNVDSAKSTFNYSTYGVLYNWTAATASCPEGWHLPSDAEWKELEIELGMTLSQANEHVSPFFRGTDQGTKMKTTLGWHNNGNGTNTSGFSGVPGGLRFGNGNFIFNESFGYWWSSTDGLPSSAWGRGLGYNNGSVIRNIFIKENGLSVRCVKNKL